MNKKMKNRLMKILTGVLMTITCMCTTFDMLILFCGFIPAGLMHEKAVNGISGWIVLVILVLIPIICMYILLHYHLDKYTRE